MTTLDEHVHTGDGPAPTPSLPDRMLGAGWPVSLGFVLLLLFVWQVVGMLGLLPNYVLTPAEIVVALVKTTIDGELLPAVALSVRRQLVGFTIGATSGVVVGLLAGVLRPAEDVFDTLVSWTYPLPKIALFPVIVVWLGFSDLSRVLVIAVSTFYPAFVNALSGTRSIDPRLLWVARNVGAGRVRTFWQVVFRAAMPQIVVGVRISLALSWTLTFATESIGASRGGLGFLIEEGFNNLLYDMMYAGIVAFAILGYIADQIWVRTSARLLHGQRTAALGYV